MANEFWQATNKLSVLKKIRKQIVLDAFCARCGIDNGSVQFTSRDLGQVGTASNAFALSAAFTVEFWYKTFSSFATKGVIFGNFRTLNADYNVEIGFLNSQVVVRVLRAGVYTTLTSAANYVQGDWGHLAVTYDGTTVKIYIDSVLDANSAAVAAPLNTSANNVYAQEFGAAAGFVTELYVGYLAEYRLWSRALLQTEIAYNMDKRKGKNADLLNYYRFNTYTSLLGTYRFPEYLDPTDTLNSNNDEGIIPSTTEYPPLILGASFIAGRYTITSPVKFSFKYPCVKPSGANFMLCVSWLDDDGVLQRYKLWDQDGVVMWPSAERYRGQTIATDFWLEVWNVDGNEDCELEEEYTLEVSKVSLPTGERDVTALELVDNPTIDTSIFQAFPLTPFPLTFESEGFGSCASPVDQTLDNMSDNLTLYGAAQT
jgi:hypothetical protein